MKAIIPTKQLQLALRVLKWTQASVDPTVHECCYQADSPALLDCAGDEGPLIAFKCVALGNADYVLDYFNLVFVCLNQHAGFDTCSASQLHEMQK